MAKARAIAVRRKAVNNIKKITRTMQLIATARFQKSLNRAVGTKPYTEKITELVEQVSAAGGEIDHPLLKDNPDTSRHALLLLTSNRGLCGGYNAGLLRAVSAEANTLASSGAQVDLYVVGKKGMNFFKFVGKPMHKTYPDLPDAPAFSEIEPIASEFMRCYEAGDYASVRIVYMKFLTPARQEPTVARLLPIQADTPKADDSKKAPAGSEAQFDFSPEPSELLGELLPVTVKVRLFQFFNDMVVSENVARMVAMKSASDAAGDMSSSLGRQFNRARQSQITLELLDIMGGVEALK